MKNDELKYYSEHNMSPEHQDISDIEVHYARRGKLYRQCGIPEIAFRDAEILEVGPGSGYNTLAFFHWNCRHVDLVEANPAGIKDVQNLFKEQVIPNDRYSIYECFIEDYENENKKYDIVIAEGFIQHIENQKEVLDKLTSLLNDKGIIVITCEDKISWFIELMKRLVGWAITQNIREYEEKVQYLTKIFEPQLKQLRGVSKPPADWVRDIILNPEINNEHDLNLISAIEYLGDGFEVLGSSPQMFTDYSWSKDIWCDYKKEYENQFAEKRLSLLMANMCEVILPVEQVQILARYFETIVKAEVAYEKTLNADRINDILTAMDAMEGIVANNMPNKFIKVFNEIKDVLLCIQTGKEVKMEEYPDFFTAFGRTQQYISFEKNTYSTVIIKPENSERRS